VIPRRRAEEPWSLASLCEELIKIGAKVVSHGRYITFEMGRSGGVATGGIASDRPVADHRPIGAGWDGNGSGGRSSRCRRRLSAS
jgi:hypothetical protein